MNPCRFVWPLFLLPLLACGGAAGEPTRDGGTDAFADAPNSNDTGVDAGDCASNSDCDPTSEFCQKSACDAPSGTCVPLPGTRATGYCSPDAGSGFVCGCDGQTYPYACIANAEGVNVASDGACALPDGGGSCTTNASCGSGLYCKKSACDAATGTCAPMPAGITCFADAAATGACGCDHLPYANDCDAASNGVNVFSEGECVLPTGPCTSQADCGGASYAAAVFCDPTVCGQPAGTCTPIPTVCSDLQDFVCGCDGHTYLNGCLATSNLIGVAYGGPCRSGAIVPCSGSGDCGSGQVCVNDPRGCEASASCPGVCLDGPGTLCGPLPGYDAATPFVCISDNSPSTEACVGTRCDGGDCESCVYTAAAPCGANGVCPSGQLCVPSEPPCDGGTCPSFCVVP